MMGNKPLTRPLSLGSNSKWYKYRVTFSRHTLEAMMFDAQISSPFDIPCNVSPVKVTMV